MHWKASLQNKLGLVHIFNGKYEQALEVLLDAAKYAEKTADTMIMSGPYVSLGIVHRYLGSYDVSLDYFTKGLELATLLPMEN